MQDKTQSDIPEAEKEVEKARKHAEELVNKKNNLVRWDSMSILSAGRVLSDNSKRYSFRRSWLKHEHNFPTRESAKWVSKRTYQ